VNIGQLTFDVKPHPEARGDMRIVGSLKIQGAIGVPCDLDHGDMLLVTVSGPDGEVLASCEATIAAPPSFVPIEDKELGLLGYERAHRAKLTD
jgi:hypothetical protein